MMCIQRWQIPGISPAQRLFLSMIKEQVSALMFFQEPIISHSLVLAFVQGIMCIVPSLKPPLTLWDLSLVLSVLQNSHGVAEIFLSPSVRWLFFWLPLLQLEESQNWLPFLKRTVPCTPMELDDFTA